MGVRIDTDEVVELFERLKKKKGVPRAATVMLVHIRSKIAPYPRVSRRPAEFESDRARRRFFALLADGKIDVPYIRSGNLAKRWQLRGDGMKQSLENNSSYAAKVQGRVQIKYHKKTGWKKVRRVLDDEKIPLGKILGQEVRRSIRD